MYRTGAKGCCWPLSRWSSHACLIFERQHAGRLFAKLLVRPMTFNYGGIAPRLVNFLYLSLSRSPYYYCSIVLLQGRALVSDQATIMMR